MNEAQDVRPSKSLKKDIRLTAYRVVNSDEKTANCRVPF